MSETEWNESIQKLIQACKLLIGACVIHSVEPGLIQHAQDIISDVQKKVGGLSEEKKEA